MARIYADENFPRPVVVALRRLGHDVLTAREAGMGGEAEPNAAVLAFAHGQSRILVTLNRRHFIRLDAEGCEHSGIIVCSYDPDWTGQADRIHGVIQAEGRLDGKLLRVERS